MFDEDMQNLPPVLQETLNEIENMSKKELKAFARSVLMNLAYTVEQNQELRKQCKRQSQEYLSYCRSSGGVTLPPNFR